MEKSFCEILQHGVDDLKFLNKLNITDRCCLELKLKAV